MSKKVITVEAYQSVYDIAVMHLGDASAAYRIVKDNKLGSMDAQLYPGQQLVVDNSAVVRSNIVSAFDKAKTGVATADVAGIAPVYGMAFSKGFSKGFKA